MAIETRFLHVAVGLLVASVSGAFTPAAAEQDPSATIVEYAIPPAAPAEFDLMPFESQPAESPWADDTNVEAAAQPETEIAGEPDSWIEQPAEAAGPVGPAYDVVVNERVQYFIDRYTGDRREIVSLWFDRSTRYLDMIREVFHARGLPKDLAFVAMIESGFNPRAVSRAGAKGMWQFMAATARRYGLRVDKWVDERLDPVKSTYAAAAYLQDLHNLFGSWPLAKAGYNAGEMKVARAIRLTGTNDFWALAESRFLRQETKNFVPAIHAATVIGRDPARYGFEPSAPETLETTTVRVPARTSLTILSARTGIPLDILRGLNPALIRATTPPGGPYELTVPEGTAESVRTALAPRKPAPAARRGKARPAPAGSHIHVVQPAETLKSIAHRYGVTVASLLRWNSLANPNRIRPGERLRVAEPRASVEVASMPELR
jgi:membrane-bound lytic murein transglycosylase D